MIKIDKQDLIDIIGIICDKFCQQDFCKKT